MSRVKSKRKKPEKRRGREGVMQEREKRRRGKRRRECWIRERERY